MSVYGINRAIEAVQRELNNSEYLFTKNELRSSGSIVFIIFENVIKELFHIYSYLLYGEDYEKKINHIVKRKKLMLGDAIECSYRLSYELDKCKYDDYTLIYNIDREYLIFKGKDDNYYKSKEIASIRGKLIHDDIDEFKNLVEYKHAVRHGINLCIEVLKDFKNYEIFPRLLEFESVVEGNQNTVINYRDEIGSILPINVKSKNYKSIIKKQIYIFASENTTKIVPAKIKINHLDNASIEEEYIKVEDYESETVENIYLKISDREDIVPLLNGRRAMGRHIENDIIFKNRSISRRQCMFEVDNNNVFVIDLGSTFGTRVNGVKIEPYMKYLVSERDEITIGEKKEIIVMTVMKAFNRM